MKNLAIIKLSRLLCIFAYIPFALAPAALANKTIDQTHAVTATGYINISVSSGQLNIIELG